MSDQRTKKQRAREILARMMSEYLCKKGKAYKHLYSIAEAEGRTEDMEKIKAMIDQCSEWSYYLSVETVI